MGGNVPDLPGERAVQLDIAVLGCDLDVLAQQVGDGDQVDRWRRDDNLYTFNRVRGS